MKAHYSPIKITIIIVIGFIFFVIFGYLHQQKSFTETWIVCNFPKKYEYYTETIKYRFIDKLYGYYRIEEFLPSTDMSLDEREEYFKKIEDTLEEDENFSYDIEKDKEKVVVKTYINASHYTQFFNDYIKDLNLNNESTQEQVEKTMRSLGYECTISRK